MKVKERAEFFEQPASWKIIVELMTCKVVTCEVDALLYVVLSRAEIHVPYRQLFATIQCVTLYPRFCTSRGRYNRVKLYEFHIKFEVSYNLLILIIIIIIQ